jgi:hypothetical protein
MDKSWMTEHRTSKKYMDGVKSFVEFAAVNTKTPGFKLCPCKRCCFRKTLRQQVVHDHLTSGAGILQGYTDWYMHGENISTPIHWEQSQAIVCHLLMRCQHMKGQQLECMPCCMMSSLCTILE